MAASDDFFPRITSTSGIFGTGLKKCMPQKSSGRFRLSARRVIEMVDVLLARMAPSLRSASTSARTAFFTFSFSTTASTTKSTSPKSPYERVGRIRPSVSAIFAGRHLPAGDLLLEELSGLLTYRGRSPSGAMSFIRIGIPFEADW